MRVAGLAAFLALAATGATAQGLVATRPGIMCRSASALGKLTLPGGDSRTHRTPVRPADAALAADGGCTDIPKGAHVTVRQAFHNTSIVTYGVPGTPPYVIPNIDFVPAGQAPPAPAPITTPATYATATRIPVTGGAPGALILQLDSRLTPARLGKLWGTGGPEMALDPHDPFAIDTARRPLLPARLRLLAPSGAVLAETDTTYPLARLEPAPIHRLPTQPVLFTIDESTGMGGFAGPSTTLLDPAVTRLAPMRFVSDATGHAGDMLFAQTLHEGWRIVPARAGGPDIIQSVDCPGGPDEKPLTLRTDRYRNGAWHRIERLGKPCDELEVLPPPAAFP